MPYLPISTAVIDVTPERAVPMGGFKGPERLTRQAEGRLEVNVVALGPAGARCVLVSLDALFVGAALRDRIQATCRERFGAPPERVLVLASHTHFAPMLDAGKPQLGMADSEEIERWAMSIDDRIRHCGEGEVHHVRAGSLASDAAVNRRLRWRFPTVVRTLGKADGGIYMCDNPCGPRDPRIRTWTYLSGDGQPLAVVWSFACHPVFFPEDETASADFVGRVREALRARLKARLPVVFAPGCMGDVWPRSVPRGQSLKASLSTLVYGPRPSPFGRAEWDRWAAALSSQVAAADAEGEVRPVAGGAMPAVRASLPLSAIFDGDSPVPELTAKALLVPGIGSVVALSCEPVTEIADIFALVGGSLVLGYEGNVFGYLPTDKIIAEGGYEPRLSLVPFGLRGRFRPTIDDRLRSFAAAVEAERSAAGAIQYGD